MTLLFTFGTQVLGWFGVGDRLAKRFAWVPLLVIAALAAWLTFSIATSWFDSALDTAEDAGATKAVVAGQNQTLEQLGDANAAEQNLRSGGERSADRYAGCLLDNPRQDTCERYNPDAGE